MNRHLVRIVLLASGLVLVAGLGIRVYRVQRQPERLHAPGPAGLFGPPPAELHGAARPIRAAPARGRRPKLTGDTVDHALRASKGNKVEAARRLGVSRATLYRFLARRAE